MQNKHSPRDTARLIATAAYYPPPPGTGYLLRRPPYPDSAKRTGKGSPYAAYVTVQETPDGLYLRGAEGRNSLPPLPDPVNVPAWHRPYPAPPQAHPLPDPEPKPEPRPKPKPATARRTPGADEMRNLPADNGKPVPLSAVTANTAGYYRKKYPHVPLYVSGGKVYAYHPPSRSTRDPAPEAGVHLYYTRHCPSRHVPPGYEQRTDLAGTVHDRYLYVQPTAAFPTAFALRYGTEARTRDPETARILTDTLRTCYVPIHIYLEES